MKTVVLCEKSVVMHANLLIFNRCIGSYLSSIRVSRMRSCRTSESGLFVFVGATTENPSFEVNSALLSRAAVYVLKSLDADELKELLDRASAEMGGLTFSDEARDALIGSADGDGRKLLNNLEIVARATAQQKATEIDGALLGSALAENLRRFDKSGDAFYDPRSARCTNPCVAAIRIQRSTGSAAYSTAARTRALSRAAHRAHGVGRHRAGGSAGRAHCAGCIGNAYDHLGSPEGELALGQAVIYLVVAPKSNAGYNAYNEARRFVGKDQLRGCRCIICATRRPS